jgi:hypothetical protein
MGQQDNNTNERLVPAPQHEGCREEPVRWRPTSYRPEPAMNVGSDKVCLEQGRLIIHAAEAMGWPIREFSNRNFMVGAFWEA